MLWPSMSESFVKDWNTVTYNSSHIPLVADDLCQRVSPVTPDNSWVKWPPPGPGEQAPETA